MLNPHTIAVQGMFLYEGANSVLDVHHIATRLDASIPTHDALDDDGYVGLAEALAPLAVEVTEYLEPFERAPDTEWPGVFEYEVTEPLGRWFASNSNCSIPEFRAKLESMGAAFFAQA